MHGQEAGPDGLKFNVLLSPARSMCTGLPGACPLPVPAKAVISALGRPAFGWQPGCRPSPALKLAPRCCYRRQMLVRCSIFVTWASSSAMLLLLQAVGSIGSEHTAPSVQACSLWHGSSARDCRPVLPVAPPPPPLAKPLERQLRDSVHRPTSKHVLT